MSRDPAPPETRAFPGARLRPSRGLRVMNGLVAALFAVVGVAYAIVPEASSLMGLVAAVFLVPASLALLRAHQGAPRGGGRLEVRPDGVWAEGRLALPRDTLERAVVTPGPRGAAVSIQRRQGLAAVVDMASVAEGRALVEALGLSATQALSTFAFDAPLAAALPGWGLGAYLAVLPPLLFGPMLAGIAWLAVPLVASWYAGLIAMSLPTRITVGLDGLLVRWLWRREILPFTELRGVEHDGERLVLTLADGRRRSLSTRWIGDRFAKARVTDTGFASREAYLDAVVDRIREAIAASRQPAEPVPASALLRRGRAMDAWVGALRALLARGAGGFREAEVVPERLWGTVEDGAADPAARAAAAVALGPALGDAERRRLRGVARVVVSPRLRVALEAAAGDDEEAVIEALSVLEQTRTERRTD